MNKKALAFKIGVVYINTILQTRYVLLELPKYSLRFSEDRYKVLCSDATIGSLNGNGFRESFYQGYIIEVEE